MAARQGRGGRRQRLRRRTEPAPDGARSPVHEAPRRARSAGPVPPRAREDDGAPARAPRIHDLVSRAEEAGAAHRQLAPGHHRRRDSTTSKSAPSRCRCHGDWPRSASRPEPASSARRALGSPQRAAFACTAAHCAITGFACARAASAAATCAAVGATSAACIAIAAACSALLTASSDGVAGPAAAPAQQRARCAAARSARALRARP